MSAWMTSQNHISYLIAGARMLGVDMSEANDDDEWQKWLTWENAASIKARYPDVQYDPSVFEQAMAGTPDDYVEAGFSWVGSPVPAGGDIVFTPPATELDEVVLLKQIGCYTYQSCEHDGWKESPANLLTDRMAHALHERGVTYDSNGYDAAPWGID